MEDLNRFSIRKESEDISTAEFPPLDVQVEDEVLSESDDEPYFILDTVNEEKPPSPPAGNPSLIPSLSPPPPHLNSTQEEKIPNLTHEEFKKIVMRMPLDVLERQCDPNREEDILKLNDEELLERLLFEDLVDRMPE